MSLGAGIDVGGAHQRLLPESIPLRFFGTAALAHVLAWIGVVVVADDIPFYSGGPGPVACAFHLLTVGVLLATAMGASLQMLPVALGCAAPAAGLCHAIYGLLVLGGIALVVGFASVRVEIIAAGAVALALSAALYVGALAAVLRASAGLPLVRGHVSAALACLCLGVLAAVLLAIDYVAPLLPDHRTTAIIHMALVAYGFLGLLALGLSQILIPMFAIAEPADGRLPAAALALTLAALAAAVGGLIAGQGAAVGVGAAVGLAALCCHAAGAEQTLARRMRRRLGGEFQLIRLSWIMLAAALSLAAGLALGLLPETAPALFGFFTLFGWLLNLVLGVQQRILPFLGSMHVLRAGARPMAPTRLVNERCLQIHRWCHLAAVALVTAGILFAAPTVIRLGGSAGAVGALAYGLFAITVFQRTRTHLGAAAMPAARTPP
ncbi:MAG: hypothetical protein U0S49_07035 [Rhodospirillales bacterium]|nr:hypothetical protein [Rhodospirillales bacterium]